MRAFNPSSGREVATRLAVADTVLSRAWGLLGRREFPDGEGLLITPCKGVHTFLMKFPIDVLFLDRDNRVIETVSRLQPHRMSRVFFSCCRVIEVPAGAIEASGTVVGHRLVIE
jgi:uncharacterized protein